MAYFLLSNTVLKNLCERPVSSKLQVTQKYTEDHASVCFYSMKPMMIVVMCIIIVVTHKCPFVCNAFLQHIRWN